jgi:hypothetical protein
MSKLTLMIFIVMSKLTLMIFISLCRTAQFTTQQRQKYAQQNILKKRTNYIVVCNEPQLFIS